MTLMFSRMWCTEDEHKQEVNEEMKMRKRFFSTALSALMLAVTLMSVGCSVENQPDDTERPSNTSSTTMGILTPPPVFTPNNVSGETPDVRGSGEPESSAGVYISEQPTEVNVENPGVINLKGSNGLPQRNTMPKELYGFSSQDCEYWFSDCVFVGDSIMLGWKNYNTQMITDGADEFFGNTRFFCEGSYGYGHALEPVTEDSLHPMFAGEKHSIEDALSLMKAKKAFICFGLNDLGIYGVDGTVKNFEELLNRIYKKNPDIDLYIISAMYMYKGSEKPKLNNKNILLLNMELAKYCSDNGITFVNIAGELIDENGFVPDKYSSDKYVHQTYAAYEVWAEVLRSVAAREIAGIVHPTFK